MVVSIDPETGALTMPAPWELERLNGGREIHGDPAQGLRQEHGPNGVTLHLDDRFAEYAIARVEGGKLVHHCLDDGQQARQAVHATGRTARGPEEQ
jgi:hypothetical protein